MSDPTHSPHASHPEPAQAAPAGGNFLTKLLASASSLFGIKNLFSGLIGKKDNVIADAQSKISDKVKDGIENPEAALGEVKNIAAGAKDQIKGIVESKNFAKISDKLGGVFAESGGKQKAGMVGGVFATADGARRAVSGLKKDESGKRNLKKAFFGAVETSIGAVVTVAAFQAKQKGGFAAQVKAGRTSPAGGQSL